MGKFIVIVTGTSATGKSTRVMQIVEFAERFLGGWEPIYYDNKDNGKQHEIGMYNVQLDLLIVGKVYFSGSVRRFQGHDAMTGKFGTSENYTEWLKSVSNKYNVLVEGYGVLNSFRSRAENLINYCGFTYVMNLTFHYDGNKEDYYNRIILRSGKKPKGESAWSNNKAVSRFHELALLELDKFNIQEYGTLLTHDESVDYVGVRLFETFYKEVPALVTLFRKFVKEFNYVDENKFENFQKCAE